MTSFVKALWDRHFQGRCFLSVCLFSLNQYGFKQSVSQIKENHHEACEKEGLVSMWQNNLSSVRILTFSTRHQTSWPLIMTLYDSSLTLFPLVHLPVGNQWGPGKANKRAVFFHTCYVRNKCWIVFVNVNWQNISCHLRRNKSNCSFPTCLIIWNKCKDCRRMQIISFTHNLALRQ